MRFHKRKGVPKNWRALDSKICLFSGRDNFKPVAVGVNNKVNTETRVFKADTAHFGVELLCSFKIVYAKSKVKFALAEVVVFLVVDKLGKLKLKFGGIISEIGNNKSTVGS